MNGPASGRGGPGGLSGPRGLGQARCGGDGGEPVPCVHRRRLRPVHRSVFVAYVWSTNRCQICSKPSVPTWPAHSENPNGPSPSEPLTLRHLPCSPLLQSGGAAGLGRARGRFAGVRVRSAVRRPKQRGSPSHTHAVLPRAAATEPGLAGPFGCGESVHGVQGHHAPCPCCRRHYGPRQHSLGRGVPGAQPHR